MISTAVTEALGGLYSAVRKAINRAADKGELIRVNGLYPVPATRPERPPRKKPHPSAATIKAKIDKLYLDLEDSQHENVYIQTSVFEGVRLAFRNSSRRLMSSKGVWWSRSNGKSTGLRSYLE
jgi:hypothetical protein